MPRTSAVCLIATACILTGCVERPRGTNAADKARLKDVVSTTRPTPRKPLALQFEDRVKLIGYDVDTSLVIPGAGFKVTWYWEVTGKFEKGWRQFTHAIDASGKSRVNLDSARVIDELYRPHVWKKGEFIKDVQEITLPKNWESKKVTLAVGFWNGPHRVEVVKGTKDSEGRGVALELPVSGSSGPAVARLTAKRAAAPPVLDGKLDEPMWKEATSTGPFVNTMRGTKASFEAQAWIAYGDDGLYVAFDVADDHLKSSFLKADDHLWEQDAVEIMVDPDGDGRNYFEMQVSPRGIAFDTRYESRRRPRPFGDMDWDSKLQAGVSVRGTLDDDVSDEGYTAEIEIPWSAFMAGSRPAPAPVKGAHWRINLYVMDAREKGQRAAGWSPPLVGDFHIPERFGVVTFPEAARGKRGGAPATGTATTPPAPEAEAAAPPPAAAAPAKTP